MYEKGQWDVQPLPPNKYQTGDIICISHRWYALPTWREKFHCLTCKKVFRTTWDDVGVIVKVGRVPYTLHADYERVNMIPLSEFVDIHIPRGMAVRPLEPTHPDSILNSLRLTEEGGRKIEEACQKVLDMPSRPWSVFSAAYMNAYERKHFAQAVEVSARAAKVHRMRREKHTLAGMEKEEKMLNDYIIVEGMLRENVKFAKPRAYVTSGSTVAHFLAELDLLPKDFPVLWKYTASDFAHDIPLKDCRMGEPRVVFRM